MRWESNYQNLPRYRKLFIAMNGFLFPVELVTRCITAAYKDTTVAYTMYYIYYVFVSIVALLEVGGFVIVAGLILRRLAKSKSVTATETTRRTFTKISFIMLACSGIVLITLVVTVLFALATSAEMWLSLNWVTRITEYSALCVLLYVFHAPAGARKSNTPTELATAQRNSLSTSFSYSQDQT